jgi:hypothetical protein
MILARRRFLQCLTGIIAAPAVVKADSLMRVFAPKEDLLPSLLPNEGWSKHFIFRTALPQARWRQFNVGDFCFPANEILDSVTYISTEDPFDELRELTALAAAHQSAES